MAEDTIHLVFRTERKEAGTKEKSPLHLPSGSIAMLSYQPTEHGVPTGAIEAWPLRGKQLIPDWMVRQFRRILLPLCAVLELQVYDIVLYRFDFFWGVWGKTLGKIKKCGNQEKKKHNRWMLPEEARKDRREWTGSRSINRTFIPAAAAGPLGSTAWMWHGLLPRTTKPQPTASPTI